MRFLNGGRGQAIKLHFPCYTAAEGGSERLSWWKKVLIIVVFMPV